MSRDQAQDGDNPANRLQSLVQEVLAHARTARRNRKSLGGTNYYANKLVELRADATNTFRQLSSQSAGDASALAELLEVAFSVDATTKERNAAAQEINFSLRTTWSNQPKVAADENDAFFPLAILSQANRGYLVSIGRQMNGCFSSGWYDASAVMMRRLLEVTIIEAFEANGIASKITDGSGNYYQLSDLIGKALAETAWQLSRNAKKALPGLRDVGHMSAHGRYFNARRSDLETLRQDCRVTIEEFLHHAKLI